MSNDFRPALNGASKNGAKKPAVARDVSAKDDHESASVGDAKGLVLSGLQSAMEELNSILARAIAAELDRRENVKRRALWTRRVGQWVLDIRRRTRGLIR